ncbi:uncharacterized protein LOC144820075 [Lissotriton helveticus]
MLTAETVHVVYFYFLTSVKNQSLDPFFRTWDSSSGGKLIKAMDSPQLFSFLLTVITVFPGHILEGIPVTDKSFRQAVLPPFEDGLNSLTSVAETLLNSNDLPQVIQNVRQLLESSHKSLSIAENSSEAQVKSLSKNIDERLDKINILNGSQKMLQDKIQVLTVQLSEQLKTAKNDLRNATDGVDKATKAWYEAQAAKKKVFFIYSRYGREKGNIASNKVHEYTEKSLKDLRKYRWLERIYKIAVEKYESQYPAAEDAIRSMEQPIAAKAVEIQILQQDLNSERTLFQNVNNFLISLRKCTSLLSTVAGKTSAANMYLELSEVLDGLLGILNEIVVTLRPLVESSTEYSLLITAKLPTIINKLEEANNGLKKAAAS